jgi:hypothetical protein
MKAIGSRAFSEPIRQTVGFREQEEHIPHGWRSALPSPQIRGDQIALGFAQGAQEIRRNRALSASSAAAVCVTGFHTRAPLLGFS